VQDVPVKFDLEWDGNTATSGYIGADWYDDVLADEGIAAGDINTGEPSTKDSPTTLTINKTAASPEEVNLTASAFIPNDNYSFRLNCPDVYSTTTYYYTLTGTCTTGNTTFNYTDVNGDTQTVVLANGENQLISAQEGTVSTAICTGTTEKGGESFDLGLPELKVNDKLEINIIFDDSGSMGSTLIQLQNMVNGSLKNELLPVYNNDPVEYEKRVAIINSSDALKKYTDAPVVSTDDRERFLKIFANLEKVNSDSTKVLNIYFGDELGGMYQIGDFTYSGGASQLYKDDLAEYRAFLNTVDYGAHLSRFIRVKQYYDNTYSNRFIENIFSGSDGFEGSKGLSDRVEASILSGVNYGVLYSSDPTYYSNIILDTLRDYGFNI